MGLTERYSLVEEIRFRVQNGQATDDILTFLRSQGASKTDSIAVFHRALSMGLDEAKRVVHFSPVWADIKERDERFWDELGADDEAKPTPTVG